MQNTWAIMDPTPSSGMILDGTKVLDDSFCQTLDLRVLGSISNICAASFILGKVNSPQFFILPRCKWVPVLLGKFPTTYLRPSKSLGASRIRKLLPRRGKYDLRSPGNLDDWRPVLGVMRATCLLSVTEIRDWLWPYGPYICLEKDKLLNWHLLAPG